MDVIEHDSAFYDVIVLQTVLEEVRNRSLPLYNRLRSLTRSDEKRFYVFHNEFRQETHIQRFEGESINDRNDRAIRKACSWYKSHLTETVSGSKVPEIVMLSDDKDNCKKAKLDGISCCSSMSRDISFFSFALFPTHLGTLAQLDMRSFQPAYLCAEDSRGFGPNLYIC